MKKRVSSFLLSRMEEHEKVGRDDDMGVYLTWYAHVVKITLDMAKV